MDWLTIKKIKNTNISKNNLFKNDEGILLYESNSNEINNNYFTNNQQGLRIFYSKENNIIQFNNFIQNNLN
jgi:parallel beta-helix repeat protein